MCIHEVVIFRVYQTYIAVYILCACGAFSYMQYSRAYSMRNIGLNGESNKPLEYNLASET